jgi:hypothetical protein
MATIQNEAYDIMEVGSCSVGSYKIALCAGRRVAFLIFETAMAAIHDRGDPAAFGCCPVIDQRAIPSLSIRRH